MAYYNMIAYTHKKDLCASMHFNTTIDHPEGGEHEFIHKHLRNMVLTEGVLFEGNYILILLFKAIYNLITN